MLQPEFLEFEPYLFKLPTYKLIWIYWKHTRTVSMNFSRGSRMLFRPNRESTQSWWEVRAVDMTVIKAPQQCLSVEKIRNLR